MTDKFKLKCKEPTYQDRLGKIEYDNDKVISGSDYLQKIVIDDSCITNGTIVGSIYAKSITFETLEVYDLSDKEIDTQIGVIYDDNSTEYIKTGKYTIQDETNQETAKNGQYKGLDDLRLLDTEYVCNITDFTNITIKDFLVDVCNQLHLTLGTTSFTNDNLPVKGNPFTNKETCRTVLKSILNCSLNFAIIDVDTNSLVIKWLDDEVSETFTKDDYDNLEKNNVYSPINSLIIRDPVISGENVIRQDEISIAEIGENQFIIEDTYFLYTEELRDLAIDNLWNKVKGLTYIDCKLTTSLGRPYLKVGQKISIEDDNGNYFDTYVLKHQFTYDGAFYSIVESPALTKEEEKRKNTTDIKTRFRNTERIVDKINGQIIDIIEEQTDTKDRLNQTISTLDGTTQTVNKVETDITNITTTTQSSTGSNHLCIDDSLGANALEYIIYGKSEQEDIPSTENSSEIKTISSIRNLIEADLLKFESKGLNLEFEGSTVKIDGTSTNQGTQTIKTKTKLKKGIYTISFFKLGGTLERKDSNDCQLFVQTSDGTAERLTNITGSRLENGENAKTTITLKEDKEIYLYFYYKTDLVFKNYEIGVQIEEGSIMHDYRPSGFYAKVRATGKNQFNLKTASKMSYSYDLPNKITSYIELNEYDSNNLSFSIINNGYAYILSNTHFLKANTEYILSYNRKNVNYDGKPRYYIYNINKEGNYVLNQNSTDPDGDKQYLFTTNEIGMVAFAWGGDNKCSGASSVISNIMIEEKTEEIESIEYESSKENEVLIDLNKYDSDGNIIGYYELCTNDILKIEDDVVELHKEIGKIVLDGTQKLSGYTENEETGYFCANYFDSSIKKVVYNEKGVISDRLLGTTIAATWEKTTEGISLGNNGQYIQFSFKYDLLPSRDITGVIAYLQENPITAYYLLSEPQDILLPKAEIPLFDGINHIQFIDDIQTTTSVYFIKKTLLSGEYVIQPQLNQTNKNLSNTDEKANKNSIDINATNTNLNNNYYNKDQIDIMNTSTEQIITQIRNQVEMTTSATNLQISVLEEKIINGATSVTTETGYKFDKDGLSISKTGEPMRSLLDNDGLTVYRDNTEMLSVRSNGVVAENVTVKTYLTIGKNTRVEDYKGGTGFFYVGGAS